MQLPESNKYLALLIKRR